MQSAFSRESSCSRACKKVMRLLVAVATQMARRSYLTTLASRDYGEVSPITSYHSGARGPLPSGRRDESPSTPCSSENICAMLDLFARAMNPCVVAFGPVLFAPSNVRGVPLEKPPAGTTFAVASVLLQVFWPSFGTPDSPGGRPASSSRKREAPCL